MLQIHVPHLAQDVAASRCTEQLAPEVYLRSGNDVSKASSRDICGNSISKLAEPTSAYRAEHGCLVMRTSLFHPSLSQLFETTAGHPRIRMGSSQPGEEHRHNPVRSHSPIQSQPHGETFPPPPFLQAFCRRSFYSCEVEAFIYRL